jgi:AP-1 complex subunit beta-1
VAKLFNTCPALVREHGFIETLTEMLSDGNAVVVGNALIALTEIGVLTGENLIKIKSKSLKRILVALNECSEWGQVYILDAIANYKPKKASSAEEVIENIITRLSHANPAIVMSAVKVILKFIDWVENVEKVRAIFKKLSNSLVSIMNSGFEIQYILLRAMHAILHKRRNILDKDFKCFYIKFFDPIYVKLEKLDILYKLADASNYEAIVKEFKTYAVTEFDLDLVQRAIKYLGMIGYKYTASKDLCIDSMKEILKYNQDFTVNQGIIVTREFLRRYNDQKAKELLLILEDVIKLVTVSESKAALLYIIGEYNLQIKSSTEILTHYVDTFNDHNERVKLQILNATIKNYVNKPEETEQLATTILQKAGEESENPDVRDRAYIYWRLLEKDPDAAKDMILGVKPSFEYHDENELNTQLVDDIIDNMTNISSIYHKEGKSMISRDEMIIEEGKEDGETGGLKIIEQKVNKADFDLLGLSEYISSPTLIKSDMPKQNPVFDIFGDTQKSKEIEKNIIDLEFLDDVAIFNENDGVSIAKPAQVFKASDKGRSGTSGLIIHGQFHRDGGKILLGLAILNNTNVTANNFDLIISSNSFGLTYNYQSDLTNFFINPESSKSLVVGLDITNENNNKSPPGCPYAIGVTLKNNIDDFSFPVPFYINVLFTEGGKMNNQTFVEYLKKNISNKESLVKDLIAEDKLYKLLERNNIFAVAKNNKSDPPLHYFSCNAGGVIPVILEISFKSNFYITLGDKLAISIIAGVLPIIPMIRELLDLILA